MKCLETKSLLAFGLVLTSGLVSRQALGQSYQLVSAGLLGGGTSVGDIYLLTGTVGQSLTGLVVGGDFELSSGFWPASLQVADRSDPVLRIELVVGGLLISWTPSTPEFVLQQTDDLGLPQWSDAPSGNQNPVDLPLTGNARLFRLVRP